MRRFFILCVLLSSVIAAAQLSKDQDAYCAYVTSQAATQKVFLETPSLETGLSQQPISTVSPQAFAGVVGSLSSEFKAKATVQAAEKTCELYRSTVDAVQRVQFALPQIQKLTLQRRLDLLRTGAAALDVLAAENRRLVEVQNSTVQGLYIVESAKAKLELDRSSTQIMIATMYVPSLSTEPLRELLAQKQALEVASQKSTNKVSQQDNWDVSLSVGGYHPINTGGIKPSPYGTFRVTYNLGSKFRDHDFDQSAAAYGTYKAQQQTDVIQLAGILKQQIQDAIKVQETSLTTMQGQQDTLLNNLKGIAGVDTKDAALFRNQLVADKVSIDVEIGVVSYQLVLLRQYLVDNF